MPTTARAAVGAIVYHALNCCNRRPAVFHTPADHDAFGDAFVEARQRLPSTPRPVILVFEKTSLF